MSRKRQIDPQSAPPPFEAADPEASIAIRSLALRLFSGHRLDAHEHTWPQLIYATDGVMTVSTDNGAWVIPSQRAAWVPADMAHAIEFTGRVLMRTLYVRPDLAVELPTRCTVMGVTPLLRELVLEVVRRGYLDDAVPEHTRLSRVVVDQLTETPEVPLDLTWPRDARARAVADRVIADLSSPCTLDELAVGSGASPRTLERVFRRETGVTFGRWRQRARLLHALRRLAEGRQVIATAVEVGYDSPSAFIAMFKRTLGKTPSQYF